MSESVIVSTDRMREELAEAGVGFIGGAFISACLGKDFALRIPPYREMVKAVIAGILMGIGAALAGGCNVGGMYNAIGNLAANGFSMWLGLVMGVILGLWLLYKEMEYITWGGGGSFTVEFLRMVQGILGLVALVALIGGAYYYAGYDGDGNVDYIASLSGLLLIAAGLGYAMQRGRWCMVQGFREPHMTGDCTLAKFVALSILLLAIGGAVLFFANSIAYVLHGELDLALACLVLAEILTVALMGLIPATLLTFELLEKDPRAKRRLGLLAKNWHRTGLPLISSFAFTMPAVYFWLLGEVATALGLAIAAVALAALGAYELKKLRA